jgi:hypothetical protein
MKVDTARDGEGLRQAIGELLERGFAESRVTRSLDDAEDGCAELMFGSLPPLTLSPGYYKRAEYLLWLDEQKKVGVLNSNWTLSEADGLAAVARARNEYERNHPPCGVCGKLQESPFATSCCGCGIDFLKRSA